MGLRVGLVSPPEVGCVIAHRRPKSDIYDCFVLKFYIA